MTDDIVGDTPGPSYPRGGRSSNPKKVKIVERFRKEPPFDPESVTSDELFSALEEIGKYDNQSTEQIYETAKRFLSEESDPDGISAENAVHLRQVSQYAKENGYESWRTNLNRTIKNTLQA